MINITQNILSEYQRYKNIGRKAIDQIPDDGLNQIFGKENNSIAIIVRHISGNLISRFTDFLTSDGEKEWRDRDSEFLDIKYDRRQVEEIWNKGWDVLEKQFSLLSDDNLSKEIIIRGHVYNVHEALCRSLGHTSYHIGQIVLLARIIQSDQWEWISIPKGTSEEYNRNPTMEKGIRKIT